MSGIARFSVDRRRTCLDAGVGRSRVISFGTAGLLVLEKRLGPTASPDGGAAICATSRASGSSVVRASTYEADSHAVVFSAVLRA
jgi:hypothetical protein